MHWTFHRSFHRGYLPRCARLHRIFPGSQFLFLLRGGGGGGDRLRIRASIVATNEEGTSLPHSFCSSIAVVSDDRSIQIAPFHDREPLCPPREMFDGASAAEEQAANFFSTDLSIVRRRWCCGRNKQVSHAQWQCCGTRETTRFTSGF